MAINNSSRNVSVKKCSDGKRIVIIDDIRFKGKRRIKWNEVKRYNIYHASMLIRCAYNKKMYLYDIIDIKKETSTSFS